MFEAILNYFSKPEAGIMGILVLICFVVIVALVRRLDAKDKVIDTKNEEIVKIYQALVTLQEKVGKDYASVVMEDTKTKVEMMGAIQSVGKGVDSIVRVLELNRNGEHL